MNRYLEHHDEINRLFNAPKYKRFKYAALIVIGVVIVAQLSMIIWANAISERTKLFMQGCIGLGAIIFVILVVILAYRVYSEYFFKRYSHCKVIHVGEKITFSRHEHASVGFRSEVSYDETFFSLCASGSYSQNDNDCSCGGDSNTRTYVLTALKRGTTKIVINDIYRNTLEKREKIYILIM
jgi:hypothetical protein